MTMLCFPNAKINIGLNIIERRPDNFHNIETVFYPIPLSDILEIIKSENDCGLKTDLKATGIEIPGDTSSNLCLKAYQLLDSSFGLPPVKIRLHKIIPMGAGLGGGSADGAYTLVLLNQLFELGLTQQQLKGYAAQLGSDCAFFVTNEPAFGTQKGDVLEDVALNLSGYYLALVKPNVFVGTAEAYSGVKPGPPAISLINLIKKDPCEWKDCVANDFEKSIFNSYPEIKAIKDSLYSHGAVYASMTCSGSAVFGLFDREIDLKQKFSGLFYWQGKL
jgi:4-diphosphocytidyl-2-C-methyl-D-erythritol kinase